MTFEKMAVLFMVYVFGLFSGYLWMATAYGLF
jgi:hypothetical protein